MAEKRTTQNPDFFKDELKRGPRGVYFFCGEEDYMKQYYLHEAEKLIVGSRDSLSFIRLTGDEFSPDALEEALCSAPMPDLFSIADESDKSFGDKRLIEVYEVDFKALKPSEFTKVCELLGTKVDEDTVVIIFSTVAELPLDSKPHQNIVKELSKVATAVEFRFESDAKLLNWISRMAAKQKLSLSPDNSRYILERVGHNMLMLKNEVEKLCAFSVANGLETVSRADIDRIVCTNMEISPFDFANALMRRDAKTAFRILADMKMRGEEPIIILSTVSRVINELISVRGCLDKGMTRDETAAKTKMHAYKVKLYIESLKNTDINMLFKTAKAAQNADVLLKSAPVDSYMIIERLICELSGVA